MIILIRSEPSSQFPLFLLIAKFVKLQVDLPSFVFLRRQELNFSFLDHYYSAISISLSHDELTFINILLCDLSAITMLDSAKHLSLIETGPFLFLTALQHTPFTSTTLTILLLYILKT